MLQFLLGMKNLPLSHGYGSIKALTKSINKSERGHELVIAVSCILLGLFLKHFPELFVFCLGMNVGSWDARTWLLGQRTRVRRGDAGGTPQTARPCRIVPRGDSRIGPTQLKSAPTRPKSVPTRPKSGRLGPYRPYRPVSAESACISRNGRVRPKFKKKKVQNTPFDLT